MELNARAWQGISSRRRNGNWKSKLMNWNDLRGKWSLLKGSAKQSWGKFTDDDLDYVAGTRDRLIGRLQEKYGMTKEEAERQAEEWFTEESCRLDLTGRG